MAPTRSMTYDRRILDVCFAIEEMVEKVRILANEANPDSKTGTNLARVRVMLETTEVLLEHTYEKCE